jgi:hypothetical protein
MTAVAIPVADRFLKPVVDAEIRETAVPFIGFAEPKGSKYADIRAALPGIQAGAPYLYKPGTGYVAMNPAKMHVVEGVQFFVEYGADGATPVTVTRTDPGSFKSPLKEAIFGVAVAYTPDGLVPAAVSFRTTKAPAAHAALKALRDCADATAWGNKSPDFRETLRIPVPFARFTATVTTRAKTGKGSGQQYYAASADIKPTTPAEAKMIGAALASPDFMATFNAVIAAHDAQVKKLTDMVK